MRTGIGRSALLVALIVGACGPGASSAQPTQAAIATTLVTPAVTPSPTASPAPAETSRRPAGAVPALDADLVGPVAMLFDTAGNMYVADCAWTESYIHKITPDGMLTTIAGLGANKFAGDGGPATEANLRCPVGMAWGPDGALYYADHLGNRVRRIDAAGIITTVAGSGADGLNVGSFSGDGGPAIEATLQEPWSVAFDAAGNLYIGDRDNYRVRRVDLSGVITTVAGTGNSSFEADGVPAAGADICPLGIAIDLDGNLLIADVCNYRIRSVDTHGIIHTIAGVGLDKFSGDGGLAVKAGLVSPDHLALDGHGGLLIGDGARIRRITAKGVISTFAGNGEGGAPTDGAAAIDSPLTLYGLAVDTAGNVYYGDGEASIYRIDVHGIITRFAGVRPSCEAPC